MGQEIELITNENSFSYITNVSSLSNEQLHTIIDDGATISTVLYNSNPVLMLHFPKDVKPIYKILSGCMPYSDFYDLLCKKPEPPVEEKIYTVTWWIDAPKSWSMGVQLTNLAHECGVSITDLTENTYGFIFKNTRTSIAVEGKAGNIEQFQDSIRRFKQML